MTKRFTAGLVLLLLIISAHVEGAELYSAVSTAAEVQSPVHPQQVAVVNTVGYHTEVYCALIWAFQECGANTTAFVDLEATAGVQEVIGKWYNEAFASYHDFLHQACSFDVVVFVTFPEHHIPLARATAEKACPDQRFVVVVHNPTQLETEDAAMLLKRIKFDVLALAPHTVEASKIALQRKSLAAATHLFVPVFPISLVEDCTGAACPGSKGAPQEGFVLQGLFQPQRRDYNGLFSQIISNESLMADPKFKLRLIGRGDVQVPSQLDTKVLKELNLPYTKYYKTIQVALVLLPAFASNAYYTSKASSSVAAAIICGTPLLADPELLAAYSYLSDQAVVLKEPWENDAASMARILSMPADTIQQKKASVAALREKLLADNVKVTESVLQSWLSQSTAN